MGGSYKAVLENPYIGRQFLRKIRAEERENTWADGLILLADRIEAVDIVHDASATLETAKSGNAEKKCAIDAWVNVLQRREGHGGVIACVTIFLVGGQTYK